MAIGYNQIICNARNLASTMNGIINALAEGVTIIGRPKILQLANNDDLLISWYEGTGGGGGGGDDEPSGGDEVLKALIERSITEITIPDGTERVGSKAFCGCSALESVNFPTSVQTVETEAFDHCSGLTSITLNEGLTTIKNYAFAYCIHLATADLPSTITEIGSKSFLNATALTSLTVRATTPPAIYSDALNSVPAAANIYVPAGSVDAYKAASVWKNRASYIQAIPS